jgi:hypothetical protein
MAETADALSQQLSCSSDCSLTMSDVSEVEYITDRQQHLLVLMA